MKNLKKSTKEATGTMFSKDGKVVKTYKTKKAAEEALKVIKKTTDKPVKKTTDKPVKTDKVKLPSFESIAFELLEKKASKATILKTFTKLYKDRKNLSDVKFIAARIAIYMNIASKKAKK